MLLSLAISPEVAECNRKLMNWLALTVEFIDLVWFDREGRLGRSHPVFHAVNATVFVKMEQQCSVFGNYGKHFQ